MNNNLENLSKADLHKLKERILNTKINVLMVGGTGVGKSSTIHALLQEEDIESNVSIGTGTEPDTMDVSCYEIGGLKIWDTPGLGDGRKDDEHKNKIIRLLQKKDDVGAPLIDLVFIVLDGGSRDYSSAYELIDNVILEGIGHAEKDRILIGINQADMALKGTHWTESGPDTKLIERLEELSASVKARMLDKSKLNVEPIYYSAGYIDEEGVQVRKPYNLQKLLSFILDRLPKKKRAAFAAKKNKNKDNFQNNDKKEDYEKKVEESVWDSILEVAKEIGGSLLEGIKPLISDPKIIAAAISFIANAFKK